MIHAKFEMSEDGRICLTLTGHAGWAEKGKDIVCAAATVLAYTAAQAVTDMHQRRQLREEPVIRLDEGDICIRCRPAESAYVMGAHAFLVIQGGFRLLRDNYPEYLELIEFGKG